MVKEIPLQNGMFALVDDEDYERVNQYIWTVGTRDKDTKVYSQIDGKNTKLSHYVLNNLKSNAIISFKNGNKLDCRKSNLFIATKKSAINTSRGHEGSSSKYKGVTWDKSRSKWVSHIRVDGKQIYLGRFDNEDDAAKAYNNAVMEYRDANAFINVIGRDNNAKSEITEYALKSRRKDGNTSKYRGVHKHGNKFNAKITKNKNILRLGAYDTEEDAAKAYDKKAIELFGDKAILNFPKVTQ